MTRRQANKAPSQRQLRVGEELRHALAEVIERGDIHDPALAHQSITITEVRVSPDLRNATVFFTPLGGGDATALLAPLRRVRPYLRHELARRVQLRAVPNLSFEPDQSFDEFQRINTLLRSEAVRRDLEGPEEGEDEDPADDIDDDPLAEEGRNDGA
ncbi:30S ribosome-binding factor RbfA [Telmatospirillum sp. J64-1]|uniref:30S ribosome-binding factor RbfA n=1 Tax=Telmatospirillum sp. J64-1 TaxID=2502183 RepID=UPI00115C7147|nr:30S ribosome-binding factor RbfA [Telmatospirillum sp. J64-1]